MKNILFFVYLLIFAGSLTANESLTPIYPHEAEDSLQKNEATTLEKSLLEFTSKGGTIIRLDGDEKPFQLIPGDMVFPACSGATNRSQALWNVLRPFSSVISLSQPHATQHGFDPFNGKANWVRNKPGVDGDEFKLWAGVPKSKKLGWDMFEEWLTKPGASPDELDAMSNYYNLNYYKPDVPVETRRIYITFLKNAHIHLYRLNSTHDSLENVVVLHFPLDDLIRNPLPEWDAEPGSVMAYTKYAEVMASYLDFSLINGDNIDNVNSN